MITIQKIENTRTIGESNAIVVELRGISTDEKPTGISGKKVDNGSVFIEIDTGKIYMYDLENEKWNEV